MTIKYLELIQEFDRKIDSIEKFKKLILNTSLACLIVLSSICYISTLYNKIYNSHDFRGIDPNTNLLFTLVFICMYALGQLGYLRFVKSFLILVLFVTSSLVAAKWGSLLPLSTLLFLLTITLTSILFDVSASFVLTLLTGAYLSFISYAQFNGLLFYDSSWLQDRFDIGDALVVGFFLIFIASLSWYSRRKINSLYLRSKEFQDFLLEQNKMLENLVAKKSEEVRYLKAEQINKINNLVEVGRNTSGLFHDLSNILTSVSLSLENLSTNALRTKNLDLTVHQDISMTLDYMGKLRNFLDSARKQVSCNDSNELFDPLVEVNNVLAILKNQIKANKVSVLIDSTSTPELYGNSVKFFQLVKNLLSNSIDSFKLSKQNQNIIKVSFVDTKDFLIIEVYDNGCGISSEIGDRVFDLFYSTKLETGGTGLGLSVCREIMQKHFQGVITYESGDWGTIFKLNFPLDVHRQQTVN